jgi:hypothetical protein
VTTAGFFFLGFFFFFFLPPSEHRRETQLKWHISAINARLAGGHWIYASFVLISIVVLGIHMLIKNIIRFLSYR